MIHLGLPAPCCRSYCCFHSLWSNSRHTAGLTVQIGFNSAIMISLTADVWCGKGSHSLKVEKYYFHFNNLAHQPPQPSSSSITKDRCNDGQKHSTSAEADESAVKRLHWPPYLACLGSLRQSSPAVFCTGQDHSNKTQRQSHRKEQGQRRKTITNYPGKKKPLLNKGSHITAQ